MNATHVRIAALATMTIDHIGLLFFPQEIIFRIIGRLSFPLFAWLIANGAVHTRNAKRYAARIGAMALVSQWPFILMHRYIDPAYTGWNIFLTLFLGLAVLIVFRRTGNRGIRYAAALIGSLLAVVCDSSYGAAGVMAIISCYVFRKNTAYMALALAVLFALFYIVPDGYFAITSGATLLDIPPLYLYQPLGALAVIPLRHYNGLNGNTNKYITYFYYPVHMLILYGMTLILR